MNDYPAPKDGNNVASYEARLIFIWQVERLAKIKLNDENQLITLSVKVYEEDLDNLPRNELDILIKADLFISEFKRNHGA